MKGKGKRNTILLVILILLVAGGLWKWKMAPPANSAQGNLASVAVEKGTIEVSVSVNGTVEPSLSRNLSPTAGGRISSIEFKNGQSVEKGALLFKMDSGNLANQLERAKLDVQQAELDRSSTVSQIAAQQVTAPSDGDVAMLEVTDGQYVQKNNLLMILKDGDKTLAVKAGVSGTIKLMVQEKSSVKKGDQLAFIEVDNIDSQLQAQDIRLEQARLSLKSLQDQLQDYFVYAPFAGVVNLAQAGDTSPSSSEHRGSWIVGDEVKAGQVLATIQSASEMLVIAPVDEVDISKVKLGQKTLVTVDALPGQELSGQVNSIETQGQVKNGVSSFDVQVVLDHAAGLKPGMTANIEIMVDKKENVLLVPIEAVQEKQGQKYVQVEDSGSQKPQANKAGENMRPVETGLYNESVIEIKSGLQEGEKVFLPAVERPADNRGMGPGGSPF